MKEFYALSEVADMLSVSKATLRRWDNDGKLKPIRHPMNNYRVYLFWFSVKRFRVVVSKTDWLFFCSKNFTVFLTRLHFLAHMCGEGIDLYKDILEIGNIRHSRKLRDLLRLLAF